MMAENDAFAATLDADSEGHEGKYYVWSEAEIDAALPPALAITFKRVYDVSRRGNWEGATILNRNHPLGPADAETEAELSEARAILLERRCHRVPPGRDDKILADWNGMMIAALATAAFAFDRADWLAMAERAFDAVRTRMSRGDRLTHSLRGGRLQAVAMLDDYAQMARAALLLYEVTGKEDTLRQAIRWVATADRHYWDDAAGGYFFTADDAGDLILRAKSALDHATPSGNSVMVEVLSRLYCYTGDDAYRQRAEQTVAAFGGDFDQSFPSLAALLNAWDLLTAADQIVLVGRPETPGYKDLLRTIAGTSLPNRVLTLLPPDRTLPPGHPAAGKSAPPDSAVAYVCKGAVCSAPVTNPRALRDILRAR